MKQKLTILILLTFGVSVVLGCGLSAASSSGRGGETEQNRNRSIIVGRETIANIGKAQPSSEVNNAPAEVAPEGVAVANGQQYTWADGGVSVTLPKNWEKRSESPAGFRWMISYDSKLQISDLAINVNEMINPRGEIPADALESDMRFQLNQQKAGKVAEVKYLTIDGVKGVFHREADGNAPYNARGLVWKSLRTFRGKRQLLLFNLTVTERNNAKFRGELEKILYSIKFSD